MHTHTHTEREQGREKYLVLCRHLLMTTMKGLNFGDTWQIMLPNPHNCQETQKDRRNVCNCGSTVPPLAAAKARKKGKEKERKCKRGLRQGGCRRTVCLLILTRVLGLMCSCVGNAWDLRNGLKRAHRCPGCGFWLTEASCKLAFP